MFNLHFCLCFYMRRKTPVVKKSNLIAHLIYDHITAGYGVRHCYHQLGRVLWPHGNVLRKSGTQQGIRAGGTSLVIYLALQNMFISIPNNKRIIPFAGSSGGVHFFKNNVSICGLVKFNKIQLKCQWFAIWQVSNDSLRKKIIS